MNRDVIVRDRNRDRYGPIYLCQFATTTTPPIFCCAHFVLYSTMHPLTLTMNSDGETNMETRVSKTLGSSFAQETQKKLTDADL